MFCTEQRPSDEQAASNGGGAGAAEVEEGLPTFELTAFATKARRGE